MKPKILQYHFYERKMRMLNHAFISFAFFCICLLQPEKQHPRDWENPGRIKVLLRQDGNPVHPIIQDSKYTLIKNKYARERRVI